jgi:hypothetical protein
LFGGGDIISTHMQNLHHFTLVLSLICISWRYGDSEAIFHITIISVDREWALTCQKFLHIVLIIDQFCCITKNSQTGKGPTPTRLTIAGLFFFATPREIPSLQGVMLFKTFIVGEGDLI